MLTQDFRPRSFEEYAGQERAKRILKAIIKNPESAPRSLLIYGPFGTGKTTVARIFAAELNNYNYTRENDISQSMYYYEFDSSVVGNVDTIKELRDTFTHTGEGYKIFVMDEVHLCSKQSQSALLKVIEEVKDNCFFLFCTTDPDKVLDTIRSRSLEIELTLIPEDELKARALKVCEELNKPIPDATLDLIVKRSNGHGRNLMMLLDNYFLDPEFMQSVSTSRDEYLRFFFNCFKGDKAGIEESIFKLQHFTLTNLKADYEELLLEIIKVSSKIIQPADQMIALVSQVIGSNLLKYITFLRSDIIMNSFTSDRNFQSACFLIYSTIGKKTNDQVKAPQVKQ